MSSRSAGNLTLGQRDQRGILTGSVLFLLRKLRSVKPITSLHVKRGTKRPKQTEQYPPGKNRRVLEGRHRLFPSPGGGASFPVNQGIQRPIRIITLLRWGFLVTSYPRFFRGTGRGGPDLEWQPRAGAEGAWSRRLTQAMRGKEVSRAPVPSAAPMVLAQTWNQGETKVRGAL